MLKYIILKVEISFNLTNNCKQIKIFKQKNKKMIKL